MGNKNKRRLAKPRFPPPSRRKKGWIGRARRSGAPRPGPLPLFAPDGKKKRGRWLWPRRKPSRAHRSPRRRESFLVPQKSVHFHLNFRNKGSEQRPERGLVGEERQGRRETRAHPGAGRATGSDADPARGRRAFARQPCRISLSGTRPCIQPLTRKNPIFNQSSK